MLSSADILNQSADVLEQKGVWIKGNFFRRDSNSPIGSCMCAHGAIAYCGDNEIKQIIDDKKDASSFVNRVDNIYSKASGAVSSKVEPSTDQVVQNNEILWAHYRAIEAGCSITFNDKMGTSKEQVIERLRQAAKTAELHGHNVIPEDRSGTFSL